MEACVGRPPGRNGPRSRIAINGPVFSHHFKMEPGRFDLEVGVPVARPVTAAGRVGPGRLPATTAARTEYRGGYEGIGAAWGEFKARIDAQGHTQCQDMCECYTAGPESGSDSTQWRTELNQPLLHSRSKG